VTVPASLPESLISLQFRLGRWGWPIHAGVVGLTGFALMAEPIGAPAPTCLFLLLVLSGTQWLCCVLGARSDPSRRDLCHRLYQVSTTLVGVTWGLGALVVAATGTAANLLFLTSVIGGAALGAVAIQHPMLSTTLLSLGSSLPLLASAHGWIQGREGLAMATMVLLFAATLGLLAWRMNASLRETMTLTREREALVGDLSDKVAQLDAARRAAERANESKSRFLAQVSHDLRQPVHAIGLFVECLKDHARDPEALQLIGRVDDSVDNLSTLFASLLDMSMLDMGRVRVRPTVFAIGPLLRRLADQFGDRVEAGGGDLVVMRCGAWTRLDRALLYRIVQNLVSNAVKYAPGARIVVGCRRGPGKTLRVEVHDQGPGIAPADLGRLFEEFTRGSSASRMPPGMGLGLAIVQGLAELMGVSVTVASCPGRGTVFRLSGLPLVAAAAPEVESTRGGGLPANLSVLLVDDDPVVLRGTGELLAKWGCLVTPATGAGAALAALDAMGGCDLLVTDQDLGEGLPGGGLLAEIRRTRQPTLPAIILSGLPPRDLEAAVGPVDRALMLNKPVRPARLRSAMLSLMTR
jgi:signal transduction histidine kinase